jgi:hypothetical protein
MGFFSKVWKGVKKTFKKIGKGIKKGFKKFGKFMGKIGWLGQIAMSFILPGIGSMMLKGLGSMLNLGSKISTLGGLFSSMAGSTNAFVSMAGKGLKFGYKVLGDVTKPFTSVIDAVTTLGKTTVNKVGGIFGYTPFKNSYTTYGDAFSSISDDFSNMYSKDRWDALDNTTSNRKTLNELQKMSDEKLAEMGYGPDAGYAEKLKGATATADGFIDANLAKQGTVTEYNPLLGGEAESTYTGTMINKEGRLLQTNYDTSLLSPTNTGSGVVPTEETFFEQAKNRVRSMPGEFVEKMVELPGETVAGVAKTAAYQKVGLAPTVDDMYPEQEEAKQGFGYIDFDASQYLAAAQTQDIDPFDLMSAAYQAGNREAQSFVNGANYGGWSRRFNAFAPSASV